jgi:transposase InsO family protein
MKLHANARLSVKGRLLLVDRVVRDGWRVAEAAAAAGVSERTAWKWLARFRSEGPSGLADRSSAPRRSPSRVPDQRVLVIAALRRLRMTGAEIAECLGMPLSTVSAILKKLGRIARPGHAVLGGQPARARRGYHRKAHDLGWEFVHVCVDDATRLAYVEVLEDERPATAVGFLRRAVAFYAAHGVSVQQLLTDNGNPYVSKLHALACHAMGIKHLRTRPYRPQTNGKAERFIRTMLGGWAYGAIYRDSQQRTAALPGWLDRYNWQRPHGALNHKPPGARLHELNNLHGSYN